MTSSARLPEAAQPDTASRVPRSIFLAAAGAVYPFAVYAAWDHVPGGVFVAVALALLVLRAATLRRLMPQYLLPVGAAAAISLALLSWLDTGLAVRAYPVLISLVFATAFGVSLLYPPAVMTPLPPECGRAAS